MLTRRKPRCQPEYANHVHTARSTCRCPTRSPLPHLLYPVRALAAHVQPWRVLLQRLGQVEVEGGLNCNESRAPSVQRGQLLCYLR